jgi:copper chaperone CopZ
MSFLSENVIPGNHGQVFGTNAKTEEELDRVKNAILAVDGIKDIIIDMEIYPKEITIHTSKLIEIKEIEDCVQKVGFHVIPKGLFLL